MRRPHHPGTTPARRAFGREHVPLGSRRHNGPRSGITPSTESRPAYRALIGNHAQHLITLPTTGHQHNGRPYHALHNGPSAQRAIVPHRHNGPSAQRAIVPHRHNGLRHDGTGTTSDWEARFAASKTRKEWQSRCHGCRTGWHSAAASALGKPSKNRRSRARSGRLQCRVGRARWCVPAFQSLKRTALQYCTTLGFGRATWRVVQQANPVG